MNCMRMLTVGLLFLVTSHTFAGGVGKGKGPDKDKPTGSTKASKPDRGWTDGRPPGWSEGEKRGWQGSLPPGLAKKDRNHPAVRKFLSGMERDEKILRDRAEARKIPKSKLEALLESFQIATRKGVASDVVRSALEALLDADPTTDEIEWTSKGLTYSLDRGVALKDVGGFLKSRLNDRLRGASLVESLYDEVDRQAGK